MVAGPTAYRPTDLQLMDLQIKIKRYNLGVGRNRGAGLSHKMTSGQF